MAATNKIRKGNDLMLFIEDETNHNYKSLAFATSHSISFSTETDSIQTKDHGYGAFTYTKTYTWEIQSSNLYIDSDYNTLFNLMSSLKTVNVAFGVTAGANTNSPLDNSTDNKKKLIETGFFGAGAANDTANANGWTPIETNTDGVIYYGSAVITSLSLSAGAGENATYEITLQGSGSLTTTKPSTSSTTA